jgi:hypothetical protein
MSCGRTARIPFSSVARSGTGIWWTCAVTIVPLFVLYDYTFLPDGAATKEQGLAQAYETGIVCSDEMMLHYAPYPSREAWCWARIEATERRLSRLDPAVPSSSLTTIPWSENPRESCGTRSSPSGAARCALRTGM